MKFEIFELLQNPIFKMGIIIFQLSIGTAGMKIILIFYFDPYYEKNFELTC